MEKLTLVIPAKYEASTLPIVLNELNKIGKKCKIIVVVPKYDKDTINVISGLNCEILLQEGEGFGNAIIQGLMSVKTEYACIFNADGSFDPKYLNEMLEKLDTQADFIFSTRYKKPGGSDDDTLITMLGNYFFTNLSRLLFSLEITDVLYTYVMGKTNKFQDLNLKNDDFTFCIELPVKVKRKNFKMYDFPSYERSRISGKKKVNELKDGFLILISILSLFIIKK